MSQQPSSAGAPQPVIVEYFVQNEHSLNLKVADSAPNIFILPKKYRKVQDVRLKDVYEAFPD